MPSDAARQASLLPLILGGGSGVFIVGAIIAVGIFAPAPPSSKPPPPKPVEAVAPTSAPTVVAPAPPVATPPRSPYEVFREKRAEIERRIAANPMVLKETDGALALYERLQLETARAEAAAKKKAKKRPKPVEERLREIEVFDRTAPIVDALHAKIAP